MSAWELPQDLEICGEKRKIRTDFRAVLDALKYFNDPEYGPDERWEICLAIILEDYEPYSSVSQEWKQEAMNKAMEFIDMGIERDKKGRPSIMDWEHDASVIIPSINRVIGTEVRSLQYLHWWTFLGAYMEIGESLFFNILNIRNKRISGKRLDKWESEFYKENKKMIDLPKRYTEEEKEEKKKLLSLFD